MIHKCISIFQKANLHIRINKKPHMNVDVGFHVMITARAPSVYLVPQYTLL